MFGHWSNSPPANSAPSSRRSRAATPDSVAGEEGERPRRARRGGGGGNGSGDRNAWPAQDDSTDEEDFPGRLLHQASIYNNVEFLQDLLQGDEGKNVNEVDKWGRSPLHTTVFYDSVDCAQLLLTAGADPNLRCGGERGKSRTPLHMAARDGKCSLVRLLLCYGADIELEDAEGKNSVDLAESNGQLETQQALLEELSVRVKRRSDLETRLLDAFQRNDVAGVGEALEALGPTDAARVINATPSGISSLLYRASHTGSLDMVRLLISHGADGRPHPITRYSPLYVACHTGRIDVAEAIIHRFPNLVTVETIEKLYPLHAACFQGHADIVKLLLQFPYDVSLMRRFSFGSEAYVAPFDVNARDMNDQTPLHLACVGGHLEAVRILLRCRVRPAKAVASSAPASSGTPVEKQRTRSPLPSFETGEEDINEVLKDEEEEEEEDNSIAQVFPPAEEIAEEMVEEKEADVSTASSLASPSRAPTPSAPPVKGFCPVELNCYSVEGMTSLHAAVVHGHETVVDLLLRHGSNLSLPIKIHPEAMSFAFLSGSHQVEENPAAVPATPSGQLRLTSALEEAALRGQASMVDLLLRHGARVGVGAGLVGGGGTGSDAAVGAEQRLVAELLRRGFDDVLASILKRKTHVDPEFKVNRKGILKRVYGPTGAGVENAPLPNSLTAISPPRPVPLQLPSSAVVVDWHHIHEALDRLKTSWLEAAAAMHNPTVGGVVGEPGTAPEKIEGSGRTEKSVPLPLTPPSSLLLLSSITRLDISENGVGSLPLAVFRLNSLRMLNVAFNKVDSLPVVEDEALDDINVEDSGGGWQCPCLEEIELQHNQLEEVAEEIFRLPSLQRLNLASNSISELPLQLWKAPSLRELNLSFNRLSCLPLELPHRVTRLRGSDVGGVTNSPNLRRQRRYGAGSPKTTGSRVDAAITPGRERSRTTVNDSDKSSATLQALLSPTQISKSIFPSMEKEASSPSLATSVETVDSPTASSIDDPSRVQSLAGAVANETAQTSSGAVFANGVEDEEVDEEDDDTGEQNVDSMEEDHVKISPLTRASLWRHKIRVEDSWTSTPDEDGDRGKRGGGGGGGGGESKNKDQASSSPLFSLNLSHNRFDSVPLGLPCLAPKLAKLNLSRNEISTLGCVNAFPAGLKHLDLSGNRANDWPAPISDEGEDGFRCFALGAAGEESVGHSPESSHSAARRRAASRTRHHHLLLQSPKSGSASSTSSSTSSASVSVHSPLSLQHFMMSRFCPHRRHWKLDHLKTLSLANNHLDRIALSLEDAMTPTSRFCHQESTTTTSTGAAKENEPNRERAQTIAAIPLNDPESSSSEKKSSSSTKKKSWLLFPNVSHLDVAGNRISIVPSTIAELSALTILSLGHNPDIVELPPEMGLLSKLWNLDLKGIPSLGEPLYTMVSKRYKTTDIVGYLKSILEDAKPYARMKLMFVGIQGIGKTSLLNRLKEESSAHSSSSSHWTERVGADFGQTQQTTGENLSTVGVDLSDWTFEKRGAPRGAKSFGPVTFRTWDFGGQREYYATHQYFLSKRSLYLVIWRITDGEKGLNEIYQWLINIQARAPNSPCIIVATHYDEIEGKRTIFGNKRREFPEDFAREMHDMVMSRFVRVLDPEKCGLPKVLGYIEVSCKTKHNTRKLANFIYDSVFDLRSQQGSSKLLLEEKIPATYLALEDVVAQIARQRRANKREPVLLKDQYVTEVLNVMNQRHSVTFRDQAELHQATQFLHDNGVLLHYDDISLKDVYFLDPQWLCDLLAHVVTIREINPFARNGVMKTSALSQLFTSKNHLFFCSPRVQNYILDLLGKFEVALTWDGEHLLIPSMLPPERHLRRGNRDTDIRVPMRGGVRGGGDGGDAKSSSSSSTQCCCDEETICLVKDHHHHHSPSHRSTPTPQTPTCLVRNRPNREGAFSRLYLMSYFPSGFWSRLMTRLLADEAFGEVVSKMWTLEGGGEEEEEEDDVVKAIRDKKIQMEIPQKVIDDPFVSAFPGEWVCWQTGIELRCFDVPLLRIREPQRELHLYRLFNDLRIPQVDYWRPQFHIQGGTISSNLTSATSTPRKPEGRDTSLQSPEEWHKLHYLGGGGGASSASALNSNSSSILEIMVPNECLVIKRMGGGGGGKRKSSSDSSDVEGSRLNSDAKKLTPTQSGLARLLSLAVDHVDNLLEDWYPDLGVRFMVSSQGRFLITRMSPCPKCLSDHALTKDRSSSTAGKTENSAAINSAINAAVNDADEDDDDDDETWELLDEDFNRKPVVVDLVTLEKQRGGAAAKGGVSPTSECGVAGIAGSSRGDSPSSVDGRRSVAGKPKIDCDAVFCFMIESLISFSQSNRTSATCPLHGDIPLSRLAPDLLFLDLPSNLLIDDVDIARGRLLGKGAFGSVFSGAVYKQQHGHTFHVAMKMLQPVHPGAAATASQLQQHEMEVRRWELEPLRGPCNSYLTARKELGILLNLDHTNIVPLLGICLHPMSLVLSLAPLGALNTILRDYKRSGIRLSLRALQLIVLQVSRALSYLHQNSIIYRDLKSENVLVWSLGNPSSPTTKSKAEVVQVKLADYGISRASLPSGTKGYAGTDGFMAPEIIRFNGEEAYTEKVDCFSFGMFVYELVSLHQPFEGYEQVKDYILDRGRPILSSRETGHPAHLLDLMSLCWSHDPADRPSAAEIAALTAAPDFGHLAEAAALDAGESTAGRREAVAACVVGGTTDGDTSEVTDEAWIVVQDVDSSTDVTRDGATPTRSAHVTNGTDTNGTMAINDDAPDEESLLTDPRIFAPPSVCVVPFRGHAFDDAIKSFPLLIPSSREANKTPTRCPNASSASSASSFASRATYITTVLNVVWISDAGGFIHVYCAATYRPLLSFPVVKGKSEQKQLSVHADRLLYVAAADQVFASLTNGDVVFCPASFVTQRLSKGIQNSSGAKNFLDEDILPEHEWLSQSPMKELHHAGTGTGFSSGSVQGSPPKTLCMTAVPRRRRVFELWCGQSGRESEVSVWYMGDMTYKRTLKHAGLGSKRTEKRSDDETGVTLIESERRQGVGSGANVWTHVRRASSSKVYRWDVAQKSAVGSIDVGAVNLNNGTTPKKSGNSRHVTCMTVAGGVLYLGASDGVILVADSALETKPTSSPLLAVFRAHEGPVRALLSVGNRMLDPATASSHQPTPQSVSSDGGSLPPTSASPWWRPDSPIVASVGRGFRGLLSANCPSIASAPNILAHSAGGNRNKTFVLSWFGTEWESPAETG